MSAELEPTTTHNLPIGLEDFGASDEQIPRLKILQSKGLFQDNLTNEEFAELHGVALGLVRQRVLFHEEIDTFEGPMCRSNNFVEGRPWRKNFPWAMAGFNEADFGENEPLPCEKCHLKDWGSHPSRDTPYCSEQFTIPFMRFHEDGTASPTIVTFQKSSVKAVKGFLSGFKQKDHPTFTAETTVTLTLSKRGSVEYSVANFTVGDPTPVEDHQAYANTFVDIRNFLHSSGGASTVKELPKGAAPTDEVTEEDPF